MNLAEGITQYCLMALSCLVVVQVSGFIINCCILISFGSPCFDLSFIWPHLTSTIQSTIILSLILPVIALGIFRNRFRVIALCIGGILTSLGLHFLTKQGPGVLGLMIVNNRTITMWPFVALCGVLAAIAIEIMIRKTEPNKNMEVTR